MLTLGSNLERTRRLFGDRSAVLDPAGGRFSWAEFADRARRCAGLLLESGLQPGDRFAIIGHNSSRNAELMRGGYAAGLVPVPVNYRLAPREIAYILDDADCRLVALEDSFAAFMESDELASWRDRVLSLEAERHEQRLGKTRPAPMYEASETDDALLVYTGGTTGRAKGVRLTHANIILNALQIAFVARPRADDLFLHVAPMFHSADLLSTPWVMAGATHLYLPEFSGQAVLQAIEQHRVTCSVLTPTMIIMMLQEPDFEDYDLSSLRQVIYGSSPMAAQWIQRSLQRLTGVEFIQAYGLTETAPLLTMLEMDDHRQAIASDDRGLLHSVGRQLPGVDMKIVDGNDRELPPGEPGEVVVRGPNVARSYLNRPDATAEAFRHGWFYTGDIGRMRGHRHSRRGFRRSAAGRHRARARRIADGRGTDRTLPRPHRRLQDSASLRLCRRVAEKRGKQGTETRTASNLLAGASASASPKGVEMNIEGKNILILGGAGMVGIAVCRRLLPYRPARLAVAARREAKALRAAEQLAAESGDQGTEILPIWGDVFLRAEWQDAGPGARDAVLADPDRRRRLIRDIVDPLDEGILSSSFLVQLITGAAPGLDGIGADAVIDCMNTATAVSYQNIYDQASSLAALAASSTDSDWRSEAESLIASLSVPQLVRHVQLLYEAMRRAATVGYVKIGTSGTGGMGFNIPFTHGEEKPSRLLLSKAAMAGAQSMLTFLLARTPDGPAIVKEIKPTALIGWRQIGYGPIRRRGRDIDLYDCPPEAAVSANDAASLVPEGRFGTDCGEKLQGVYIDTGENGLYSADEFTAITAPGLMQMVTPEDVADNAVRELVGSSTGHDVVAALDAAATGPTFRGGHLRQAALERLAQLEAEHGKAIAFEILGPPRLSKLLYEAHLLKLTMGHSDAILAAPAAELSALLEQRISDDGALRRRILSIGIPILLPDAVNLLRGPLIKSRDSYHGWVDLTPQNMQDWQQRIRAIRESAAADLDADTSSQRDRLLGPAREWNPDGDILNIGEIAAWILDHEEGGHRQKD
jgi:acyl-CoA synthetase (AMP-forming)/AMP-acid ligase II/NAD(P)-dependent dehydrogenase (short-subunit alcohol dehydrogenase family)